MLIRRSFAELTKSIYSLLKKNPNKEYSINQISKLVKTRWDSTSNCLDLLLFLDIVVTRREDQGKTSSKLFKYK